MNPLKTTSSPFYPQLSHSSEGHSMVSEEPSNGYQYSTFKPQKTQEFSLTQNFENP
jgi:hypothetical protein